MSADTTPSMEKRSALQRVLEEVLDGFLELENSELTDTQFAPLAFGDFSLKNPTYWQIGVAFINAIDAGEVIVSLNGNPKNRILLSDSSYTVLVRRDLTKGRNVHICLINDDAESDTLRIVAPQMLIDCVHAQAEHQSYNRDQPTQKVDRVESVSGINIQILKADLTRI